jgi:aspartyl-tRNA(Asn)/glutamyl-tRNA(Gln) amidotransferase subunit A
MTQADGAAFHRERLAEHPEWFGEDVRRRLEAGRDLRSSDYVLARHTQAETKYRLGRLFDGYQILILPSTPICAPTAGQDAVEQSRTLTRFTAPFNLAGLPAISVPCGISRTGLPIGLQMVAPAWGEAALLRAARAYEQSTSWHERRPPGI